jgi:hypothetical protein
VATDWRTAAPGLEGSPIEVPGVREMVAISVVGILGEWVVVMVVVPDVVVNSGCLVFELVDGRREIMWYDDQIEVEQ